MENMTESIQYRVFAGKETIGITADPDEAKMWADSNDDHTVFGVLSSIEMIIRDERNRKTTIRVR